MTEQKLNRARSKKLQQLAGNDETPANLYGLDNVNVLLIEYDSEGKILSFTTGLASQKTEIRDRTINSLFPGVAEEQLMIEEETSQFFADFFNGERTLAGCLVNIFNKKNKFSAVIIHITPGNDYLIYKQILENSKDLIFVMSLPECEYLYINPAIREICGYNESRFYSDSGFIFRIADPDYKDYLTEEQKKLMNGVVDDYYDFKIIHRDGRSVWIRQSNKLLKNSEGKPAALIGIARDNTQLKVYEEALLENEILFSKYIENNRSGILIHSEGKALYANKKMAGLLGNSQEVDLTGKAVGELFVSLRKSDPGIVEKIVAEKEKFEINFFNLKEESVFCEVSSIEIDYNNQKSMVSTFYDISIRKQAEANLISEEKKFREIFDNASDGILILDDKLKIIEFNAEISHLLNTTKISLKGNPAKKFLPDNDVAMLENWFLKDDFYTVFESFALPKNREGIFVEISAKGIDYKGHKALLTIWRNVSDRKIVEAALLESENRYRMLFESANDAIFIMVDDLIIDCNDKALELFRGERKHIVGFTPHYLSPSVQPGGEASQDMAQKKIQSAIAGENQVFEWEHRRIDNSLFHSEISLSVFQLSSGQYIQAIIRDISERKRLDLERKERMSRLEKYQSAIIRLSTNRDIVGGNTEKSFGIITETVANALKVDRVGIWLFKNEMSRLVSFDMFNTNEREHKKYEIINGNSSLEYFQLLRMSRAVPVDDVFKSGKFEGITDYLEKNDVRSKLDAVIRISGEVRGVITIESFGSRNWQGDEINFAGEIADQISQLFLNNERRKAEEDLQKSEESYRSLFKHSAFGIYQSTFNGMIEICNPAFVRIFGYNSEEEIIKKGMKESFYVDKVEHERFNKLLLQFGSLEGFETEYRKKNGNIIKVRESARLTKNLEGNLIIEGTIEDITSQKNAEKAIMEARIKAEKSDQLKSEFLAQMSHEIRTPLNAILSFSGLLKEMIGDNIEDDLKSSFQIMSRAGKRIIRTIDLLLDMSQMRTGTYDYVKRELSLCSDILENIYLDYKKSANEKKIGFELIKKENNSTISADEYTLKQIFYNLIDNAIKYTDEGKVEVVVYRNKKNNLVVDVIDTGIGIDEEYMPSLFDLFTQEHQGYTRRYEGNGLGLALVQKYCELNNAKLKVKSKKGEGTVFTVEFIP